MFQMLQQSHYTFPTFGMINVAEVVERPSFANSILVLSIPGKQHSYSNIVTRISIINLQKCSEEQFVLQIRIIGARSPAYTFRHQIRQDLIIQSDGDNQDLAKKTNQLSNRQSVR